MGNAGVPWGAARGTPDTTRASMALALSPGGPGQAVEAFAAVDDAA